MLKTKINSGYSNYSGDNGDMDGINVVAVNGTNVASTSTASSATQAKIDSCNAFKNLFHIGGCPVVTTSGTADATPFDATNPSAYGSATSFTDILKNIGTYTKPPIGVDVSSNQVSEGTPATNTGKKDYTWWIVGACGIGVIIAAVFLVKSLRK